MKKLLFLLFMLPLFVQGQTMKIHFKQIKGLVDSLATKVKYNDTNSIIVTRSAGDKRYHLNYPTFLPDVTALNNISTPVNTWVGFTGLYNSQTHAGGLIACGQHVNTGLPQLEIYGTYYEDGLTDGSGLYFRNKNSNYNTAADGWLPWYKILTQETDMPKIVHGSNSTRTTDVSSFNDVLPTGVYNGYNVTGTATGNYEVMFRMRHTNETNHYAADIVSTMGAGGNYLGWRQVNNGTIGPWYKIFTGLDSNFFIQNQYASAQSVNAWISGNMKATNHVFSDGSYLSAGTGATHLLNSFAAAQSLKVGGLVVSDAYTDNAPTNGIFVKGSSYLSGDTYTDAINPYSGNDLVIGDASTNINMPGTVVLPNTTATMLKTDITGKVLGAASGTDYLAPSAVDAGYYLPTVSLNPTGSGVVLDGCTYMRIGNVMHVSVAVSCSSLTSGVSTMEVSLPSPSSIPTTNTIMGTVSGIGLTAISPSYVEGNTSTNKASVKFTSSTTATVYAQFQYQIF